MLEVSSRICKDQFYEHRPTAKAFTLNSTLPWLRQLKPSSSTSALHCNAHPETCQLALLYSLTWVAYSAFKESTEKQLTEVISKNPQ